MVRWGDLSPHRSVETLGTIPEELSNKWVSMSRSRVGNEINSTFLQAGIGQRLMRKLVAWLLLLREKNSSPHR